jgi:3-polyprenyl-4-hydroxybenzoate decarboxylase
MTFRVQADRDLIVVQGARGKHIDPSIRSWEPGKGGLPTTAKLGIDSRWQDQENSTAVVLAPQSTTPMRSFGPGRYFSDRTAR